MRWRTAIVALLLALGLSACGKYGPPVRSTPPPKSAEPAQTAEPPPYRPSVPQEEIREPGKFDEGEPDEESSQ